MSNSSNCSTQRPAFCRPPNRLEASLLPTPEALRVYGGWPRHAETRVASSSSLLPLLLLGVVTRIAEPRLSSSRILRPSQFGVGLDRSRYQGLSSSRILRLSLGLVRGINTGGNNLLRRPSQLGGSRLGGSELTGLPFWLTCTNHRNRGRTSAARSTRATRMLTVPRSLNKSSTKDLT